MFMILNIFNYSKKCQYAFVYFYNITKQKEKNNVYLLKNSFKRNVVFNYISI